MVLREFEARGNRFGLSDCPPLSACPGCPGNAGGPPRWYSRPWVQADTAVSPPPPPVLARRPGSRANRTATAAPRLIRTGRTSHPSRLLNTHTLLKPGKPLSAGADQEAHTWRQSPIWGPKMTRVPTRPRSSSRECRCKLQNTLYATLDLPHPVIPPVMPPVLTPSRPTLRLGWNALL